MRPFVLLAILSFPALCFGADLQGRWEIQSMGADREVTVQQKGQKLIVYRVMWPEFEGKKYKLEHLYKGILAGSQIKGQLLVKEEELPTFEALRPFVGMVSENGELVIDGMILKRLEGGPAPAAPPPAEAPKGKPMRPSEPPMLS